MTQSLYLRTVLIAVLTTGAAHELLAVPAPPFLSCSTECSDAYVIKYCNLVGQGCSRSSIPECSGCQYCRYRSAGEPNNCIRDTLVPTYTLTTGPCAEDCLCASAGAFGLTNVEGTDLMQVGEPIPDMPRHVCSNSFVQPAE